MGRCFDREPLPIEMAMVKVADRMVRQANVRGYVNLDDLPVGRDKNELDLEKHEVDLAVEVLSQSGHVQKLEIGHGLRVTDDGRSFWASVDSAAVGRGLRALRRHFRTRKPRQLPPLIQLNSDERQDAGVVKALELLKLANQILQDDLYIDCFWLTEDGEEFWDKVLTQKETEE